MMTVEQIRTQASLFGKLFIIMGITYIGESIHILLHGDHSNIDDCNFYSEVKHFFSQHSAFFGPGGLVGFHAPI